MIRYVMMIVAALFLMMGCSSTTVKEASSSSGGTSFEKNECVTAGAAYELSYREKSGTCGTLPTQVLMVPEDGVLTADGCTNGSNARYDGCSVYIDSVCKSGNLTINQKGKVNWSEDGSSGEGVITITGTIPGDTCSSTYEVTATRL